MKIFPDINYLALNQMEPTGRSSVNNDSEDERNCVNEENKEEDDEFSTYFTDNKVQIPEDDKVN